MQCSLTIFSLLILLWVIFVNFSLTAQATASSTNNLTEVVITTVVKYFKILAFSHPAKTNSMEQGLLEKLIVIYVLEQQFPSFMEYEGSLLFS